MNYYVRRSRIKETIKKVVLCHHYIGISEFDLLQQTLAIMSAWCDPMSIEHETESLIRSLGEKGVIFRQTSWISGSTYVTVYWPYSIISDFI